MNRYFELKTKQQEEFNSFSMMFAFNQVQFDEGMRKLGLEPTDRSEVLNLGGGCYMKKADSDKFHEMFAIHKNEMKQAISEDLTGDGFIFDMFNYELANHEYNYTLDVTDAIESLGLTEEEINNDKRLFKGLSKARKNQF